MTAADFVTFVADEETPPNLRRYHGKKIPLPEGPGLHPVGTIGHLGGLPGEWSDGEDGPQWLLREPTPQQPRPEPPPEWAAELRRPLDELLAAVHRLEDRR